MEIKDNGPGMTEETRSCLVMKTMGIITETFRGDPSKLFKYEIDHLEGM